MSDQQISKAAGQIADAQTTGPITQLVQQMARNSQQASDQAKAAQAVTAGYQAQLAPQVAQSNEALARTSSGLNSTLAGIGTDTQNQIGAAYAPSQALQGLQSQGLGGGGLDALAAAMANQKGAAATSAGGFRGFGAQQGASAQSLGAANQGTFAVGGQAQLGAIGRAGQLAAAKANAPVSDRIAGLQANRGNLYGTALGRLIQQNQSLGLSQAALNIKGAVAQTGQRNAQTNAARQQSTAAYQQGQLALGAQRNQTAQQLGLARNQLGQAKEQDLQAYRQADLKIRQEAAANKKAAGGLTPDQRVKLTQASTGYLNAINGLASRYAGSPGSTTATANSPAVTMKNRDGTPTRQGLAQLNAIAKNDSLQAQAAWQLAVYHHVSPSVIAGLQAKYPGIAVPRGWYPPKGR